MQICLAAVSLCQRHKQPATDEIVLNVVPVLAHDTDDFHVVRRTVLRWLRVANMLADRVLIREKFFRHFFVNDRHTARVFVFAFFLSEIAATEQFYPECLAVAGCDRGEE